MDSRGVNYPLPRTGAPAGPLAVPGVHGARVLPRPASTWMERWRVQEIRDLLVFELAYFLSYRAAMAFTQASAAPLWFPDSVLLCALLLTQPRRWWWFVLGTLPVRLLAAQPELPLWFLFAAFAVDSVKGVVLAAVLRRALGVPTLLTTVRRFARYCLVAVLLVPAVMALPGAAARQGLGYDFWTTWQQWFIGNALTYLVVTPALFHMLVSFRWPHRWPPSRVLTEVAILGASLIVTSVLALGAGSSEEGPQRLLYAPVPFLLWAAIRFGMTGASFGILTLVSIFVGAALLGLGPFVARFPDLAVLDLQEFLLLTAAPYYFVAVVIDQEAGVERSLRESESRFGNLAENAPAMIWMSGPDLRRNYFNQQWLAYTGAATSPNGNGEWMEHVHPEDQPAVVQAYRQPGATHRPITVEYRLRGHDGQYCPVLDQGVPRMATDGTCMGYVGLCVDLGDRKRFEAEQQLHRIELAHAGRVATMGQLASALAHELNQPLAAILRNAEAAEMIMQQEPADRAEVLAILSDIRQDDQRAGDVIDRMRAMLTRSELRFEAIVLKPLYDQIGGLLRQEMLSRRVTLQFEVPQDIPPVRGDRVHLQQVLINLVVNGADALNEARGEHRRLQIAASRTDEHTVTLSVRDRGHGIPEEALPRLFEPFYTTKASGMGIGLAISKAIVEAHGGRIWAENNPEGGASLSFTLKVAELGG